MAADDFALVIAIQNYRDTDSFPTLEGPHNDARDFVDWLKLPGGGNVPENHILPYYLRSDAAAQNPDGSQIWGAINRVRNKSAPGTRIGRRLYVFMAGHGVGKNLDETGLLPVETDEQFMSPIFGSVAVDVMRSYAHFDEVVLFMDCCRVRADDIDEPHYPFKKEIVNRAGDVVRFVAYASEYGKVARERHINGQHNGIFSRALIDGLKGAAADETGSVTSESLMAYLPGAMKILLNVVQRQDPHFPHRDPITFVSGLPVSMSSVRVTISNPVLPVSVLRGQDLQPVNIAALPLAANVVKFDLLRMRSYVLRKGVPDQAGYAEQLITTDKEAIDVTL